MERLQESPADRVEERTHWEDAGRKLRWKKGEITPRNAYGESVEIFPLRGFVHGPMGIEFDRDRYEEHRWILTHLPSGQRIIGAPSRDIVKGFAAFLLDRTGVEAWESESPEDVCKEAWGAARFLWNLSY